ncbi:MAG: HAD family acid phosphatase [Woeseia sp.]
MIKRTRPLFWALLLSACASPPAPLPEASDDYAILWVRDAAEWEALSLQAYNAATRDLPLFLDDRSWSALPYQDDADYLPPAIIVDVDETMVSNVHFQLTFEPPFANYKLDDWNAANPSLPVPGAPEFINLALASGVTVFYVTNRPCEPKEGIANPCPQKQTTIDDLNESGIPADEQTVMLANEQPDWKREKKVRRDIIAESYRVIMLIGDDLGDFIPCVRKRAVAPCTEGATAESRRALTREHAAFWGSGWYALPNPMHGSWTTID